MGYLYMLDGRDLLIRSMNIFGVNQEYTYRVMDAEIFDVSHHFGVFPD